MIAKEGATGANPQKRMSPPEGERWGVGRTNKSDKRLKIGHNTIEKQARFSGLVFCSLSMIS